MEEREERLVKAEVRIENLAKDVDRFVRNSERRFEKLESAMDSFTRLQASVENLTKTISSAVERLCHVEKFAWKLTGGLILLSLFSGYIINKVF
ncbi:MAG: hypothetical protein LBU73_04895 [Helicobacteraceae bacterium]|jgi:septation ring formation regulator EzrA|nr:hypothetical protein [Helicobacteraceae bacterium]